MTLKLTEKNGVTYLEANYGGLVKGVVTLVGLGLLLHSCMSSSKSTPTDLHQAAISRCFSAWDGSNRELVEQVKNNLRDPDSFEHIGTHYTDKGSYLALVMKYRAKNGFGGYNVDYANGTCSL
jgi:hypothetical protein